MEEAFLAGWRAAHSLLRFQDAALHTNDPDERGFPVIVQPMSQRACLLSRKAAPPAGIMCTVHDYHSELREQLRFLRIFHEAAARRFSRLIGAFVWHAYAMAQAHSTDPRLVKP